MAFLYNVKNLHLFLVFFLSLTSLTSCLENTVNESGEVTAKSSENESEDAFQQKDKKTNKHPTDQQQPLKGIQYERSEFIFSTQDFIRITPKRQYQNQSNNSYCRITPQLPEGLNFDSHNCTIFGESHNKISNRRYTIYKIDNGNFYSTQIDITIVARNNRENSSINHDHPTISTPLPYEDKNDHYHEEIPNLNPPKNEDHNIPEQIALNRTDNKAIKYHFNINRDCFFSRRQEEKEVMTNRFYKNTQREGHNKFGDFILEINFDKELSSVDKNSLIQKDRCLYAIKRVTTIDIFDITEISKELTNKNRHLNISSGPIYEIKGDDSFILYLTKSQWPGSQKIDASLEVIPENGRKIQFFDESLANFSSYPPLVFKHLESHQENNLKYYILLLSNDRKKLSLNILNIQYSELESRWSKALKKEVSLNEWWELIHLSREESFHLSTQQIEQITQRHPEILGHLKSCRLENAKGQKIWKGFKWGHCHFKECNDGFHRKENQCVSSVRSCQIQNGLGKQIWNKGEWLTCEPISCNRGYIQYSGQCIAEQRECRVKNGSGVQNFRDGRWSECRINQCHHGHFLEKGKCVEKRRECSIKNGKGLQEWNGERWGDCEVQVCDQGYELNRNNCELQIDIRSCEITNGIGEQKFINEVWSDCIAISCDNNFFLSEGMCLSTKKDCSIKNGTGEQLWNGKAWEKCLVTSCDEGYSKSSNKCIENQRQCDVTNGIGYQIWDKNKWSSCIVESCDHGYFLDSNTCQSKKRSCQTSEGTGEQLWNDGAWEECVLLQCHSGKPAIDGVCLNCPDGTIKNTDGSSCIEVASDEHGPLFTTPTRSTIDRKNNIIYIYDASLNAIISINRNTKHRKIVSGYYLNDPNYRNNDQEQMLIGKGPLLSQIGDIAISQDGKTLYAIDHSSSRTAIVIAIDVETGDRKPIVDELILPDGRRANNRHIYRININPDESFLYLTVRRQASCIYQFRISDGKQIGETHCELYGHENFDNSYRSSFARRHVPTIAFNTKANKQYLLSTGQNKNNHSQNLVSITECSLDLELNNFHPNSNKCHERELRFLRGKLNFGPVYSPHNMDMFVDEENNHLHLLVELVTGQAFSNRLQFTTFFYKVDLKDYRVLDSYTFSYGHNGTISQPYQINLANAFDDLILLRVRDMKLTAAFYNNMNSPSVRLREFLSDSNQFLVRVGNLRNRSFDILTSPALDVPATGSSTNLAKDELAIYSFGFEATQGYVYFRYGLKVYDPTKRKIVHETYFCPMAQQMHTFYTFRPGDNQRVYAIINYDGQRVLLERNLTNGQCNIKSGGSIGSGDQFTNMGHHLTFHPTKNIIYTIPYGRVSEDTPFKVMEINLNNGNRRTIHKINTSQSKNLNFEIGINDSGDTLCFATFEGFKCVDTTSSDFPVVSSSSKESIEFINFGNSFAHRERGYLDVDNSGNLYVAGKTEVIKFERKNNKLTPLTLSGMNAGSGFHIGQIQGINLNSQGTTLRVYDGFNKKFFNINTKTGRRIMLD